MSKMLLFRYITIALYIAVIRSYPTEPDPCSHVWAQVKDNQCLHVNHGNHECCQGSNVSAMVRNAALDTQNLVIKVDSIRSETQEKTDFTLLTKLKSLTYQWHREFSTKIFGVTPTNFSHPHFFKGLEELEVLRINIPTVFFIPDLLLNLTRLDTIDLTNVAFMDNEILVDLWRGSRLNEKPITTVILRNMKYTSSELEFRPMNLQLILPLFRDSNITHLDLSYNGDVLVYPGLIKYVHRLKHLDCSHNKLRYSEAMSQCFTAELWFHKQLTYFSMSEVEHVRPIVRSGSDILREVHSLPIRTMLIILECALNPACQDVCVMMNAMCASYIGPTPCEYLPSFEEIYQVDYTCPYNISIIVPPKMEVYNHSGTVFGFVADPGILNADVMVNDQKVCFQDNVIRVFDASNVVFPDVTEGIKTTIQGWDKLEELYLTNSDYIHLFSNTRLLHTMPAIRILHLSNPAFSEYLARDTEGEIFSNIDKVEEIRVRSSHLNDTPTLPQHSLDYLRVLDLNDNEISNIDISRLSLSNLPALRLLDLSNNLIQQLSLEQRRMFATRMNITVDLTGNPFVCNCENLDFIAWIQTSAFLQNKESYQCQSYIPGETDTGLAVYRQILAEDINDLTRRCTPSKTLYYIVGTVPVSILLLIILIVVAYRNRWKIRYFVYAIRHASKVITELKGQYQYDGFVVYSEHDRKWVHKMLLKKLEEEMNLKLCVHYRDFIPGHNIEEQIVQSVAKSRKTILVLTSNFFKSKWCDFEMQMARNRLYNEGNDVLVIVLLEQLPISQVSKTMKNLLDTKTYLQWYTNTEGQELFFKQMKLALCPGGVSVKTLEESPEGAESDVPAKNSENDYSVVNCEESSYNGIFGKVAGPNRLPRRQGDGFGRFNPAFDTETHIH